MSDDLVKRLRDEYVSASRTEVADRIEALEAENERLRKALDDAINEPMGVVPESASAFYDYRAGRVRTQETDR